MEFTVKKERPLSLLFLFFLLVMLCSLWDLSSSTRNWTWAPKWKCPGLTSEPPGNFQMTHFRLIYFGISITEKLYNDTVPLVHMWRDFMISFSVKNIKVQSSVFGVLFSEKDLYGYILHIQRIWKKQETGNKGGLWAGELGDLGSGQRVFIVYFSECCTKYYLFSK